MLISSPKLQHMIDEGIENGVYIVTEDKTLEDLKLFRSFLYYNFKKYERYEKMLPISTMFILFILFY